MHVLMKTQLEYYVDGHASGVKMITLLKRADDHLRRTVQNLMSNFWEERGFNLKIASKSAPFQPCAKISLIATRMLLVVTRFQSTLIL